MSKNMLKWKAVKTIVSKEPPKWNTFYKIRHNFLKNGTIQNVHKQIPKRPLSSTNPAK